MRLLQFTSFLVFAILSSNAYGMEPIEEDISATYVVKSTESPEDIVDFLLSSDNPPKHILLEGTFYTPQEYYMVVGANDANSSLGRKYKVELERILRDSFTLDEDNIDKPKAKRPANLSTSLNRYSKLFHYDDKLQFLRSLILCEEKVLDISFVAHALRKHCQAIGGSPKNSYQENLLKKYQELYLIQVELFKERNKIHKLDLKKSMEDFDLFIDCVKNDDFPKYYEKNRITAKSYMDETLLLRVLVDNMWSVLLPLSKHEDPLVFDAFFLKAYKLGPHITAFTRFLYNKFQDNNLVIPSSLNLVYSYECLYRKKKHDEAIQVYLSILSQEEDEDNIYQTPYNYALLALMLGEVGRYEEALAPLKMAVMLDSHPILRFRLACYNIRLGKDVDESLTIMSDIMKMSKEDMLAWGMSPSRTKRMYLSYLQAAGRTDEVTKFLLEKQAKALIKALERSRTQGKLIKTNIAENKRLEQQRKTLNASQPKIPHKAPSTPTTSSCSTSTYDVFEHNNKKKNVLTTPKKEKKKRRGEAYKGMTSPQLMNEQMEEAPQPFLHIEQITTNKNAWKTFEKLFSLHQRGNTFDNEVKISLSEIITFFKALKQDYDPSQGKGAHRKTTLNFQGYGSEMEDQMIVLTTSTYLKEYQIKHIREAFINARIIPADEDILIVLQKDYPDLMKEKRL